MILDVSENESFDSWLGYTFGDDDGSSSLKGRVFDLSRTRSWIRVWRNTMDVY